MSDGTKPSNPKEAFGDAKLPLGLVPDTAIIEENLAFLEGALKYGQYNWRVAGVKASTYNRAIRRHLKRWWNGQDRDPITRVRDLASIRACCAILIDAEILGMLNDDRPPRAEVDKQLTEAAEVAKHLKELFKDHPPIQYTQAWVDSPANPAFVPPPARPLCDSISPVLKHSCVLSLGHGGRHASNIDPARAFTWGYSPTR